MPSLSLLCTIARIVGRSPLSLTENHGGTFGKYGHVPSEVVCSSWLAVLSGQGSSMRRPTAGCRASRFYQGASCLWVGGGKYLRFQKCSPLFALRGMIKQRDCKRFTTAGFMMQAIATCWYDEAPAQLVDLADDTGRARIIVMYGTVDGMMDVSHGLMLIKRIHLGEAVIVEGMCHDPVMER
ncbi:hypothetical protein BX600DRAFT_443031 [Xylariales sp. PMI_506]|nr:hypothetical protein BX600DRAFT_443031 [Xylariales sp. PMI_506]